MSVFQPARRRPKWRLVLGIYDGRECPECFAVACGTDAKIAHRQYHDRQRDHLEMLNTAIRVICDNAGLAVAEQQEEPAGGSRPSIRKHARVASGGRWDDDDDSEGGENDDD